MIPSTVLKSVLWRGLESSFAFWKFKLLCFSLRPIIYMIIIVMSRCIYMFCGFWIKKYFVLLSMGLRPPKGIIQTYIPFKIDLYSATDCPIKTRPTFCSQIKNYCHEQKKLRIFWVKDYISSERIGASFRLTFLKRLMLLMAQ